MNLYKPPQFGPLRPQDFRCDLCGGIFEKGMSEEEALAELNRNWPGMKAEECGMVCDDCHNIINPVARN